MEIREFDQLTKEDERIFNATNYFSQLELFPSVTENDIMNTLFFLKRYRETALRVRDYEQHMEDFQMTLIEGESARKLSSEEYYANKTANAVILYAEKQPAVFAKLKEILSRIERAHNCILKEEQKRAVKYRYLDGYSYKDSISFFRGMSPKTFDRRLAGGIFSMAETLKLGGFFEEKWNY